MVCNGGRTYFIQRLWLEYRVYKCNNAYKRSDFYLMQQIHSVKKTCLFFLWIIANVHTGKSSSAVLRLGSFKISFINLLGMYITNSRWIKEGGVGRGCRRSLWCFIWRHWTSFCHQKYNFTITGIIQCIGISWSQDMPNGTKERYGTPTPPHPVPQYMQPIV